MIKLFRNIRLTLLNEGKTSRYLKYALGEIVLVVIGILIALQINNWNQQRISRLEEIKLLQACREGLLKDLSDIDHNVATHTRALASADYLLDLLATNKPYNRDTVALKFSHALLPTLFVHSVSAFETMKSKGVTIVSNVALRDNIIKVYDSDYRFFITNEEAFVNEIERGVTTVLNTRFEESWYYDLSRPGYPGKLTPIDFEALKSDQDFLFFFRSMKNRIMILKDFQYAKLRNSVVNLIEAIEQELQARAVSF